MLMSVAYYEKKRKKEDFDTNGFSLRRVCEYCMQEESFLDIVRKYARLYNAIIYFTKERLFILFLAA